MSLENVNDYERRMAEDFGPLAKYSEFRRGDTIAYVLPAGQEVTGDVLWVIESGETSVKTGDPLPLTYIVERTGGGDTWPDFVYQSQIKGLHGPQEEFIHKD